MSLELEANVIPTKARKILTRLENVEGVHEDTLDAVLNLVNPFPDYTPKRVGWPDSRGSSSVVFYDLFEATIKQPSGLSAGETWDLHALMLPQAFEGQTATCSLTPFSKDAPSASTCSSFNVHTAVSGSLPAPLNTEPAVKYTFGSLAQGAPFRVVSMGMELVNISADLYRGGASFGYRYDAPVAPALPYTSQAPAGVLTVSAGFDATLYPPTKPDDIDDWPNTFIGDGRDGLYVTNLPLNLDNPPLILKGRDVAYFANPNGATNPGRVGWGSGGHIGWCIAGGFLTGLTQGSSILVKYRVGIEVFPSCFGGSTSLSLVRLSNKTVPRSPVVDEILARIISDMPAGCEYTKNPLGEWFSNILSAVAEAAPKVGAALSFLPGAAAIGQGVGALSGAASKALGSRRKPKASSSAPAKKTGKSNSKK